MKRPVAFVVLAGVAALLASVLVYSALKKREAEVKAATATTCQIVVAAHDLPLGAKIDAAAVKMARWSRDSIPPGALTDASGALNAFVKSSMVENEPLVAAKLFTGDKTAGVMPLLIPPGMRAVSVPVDEVSDIAGFVLPHARVDVLAAMTREGTNGKTIAKIVLQNVEVLAVAQEIEGRKDQPELVRVVTLLVTPQDAEKLALASHEGSLRLAMRNYNDDKFVVTAGADLETVLTGTHLPVPVIAQQPEIGHEAIPVHITPTVQIEIMRDGKSRQSVSFVRRAAMGPTSGRSRSSAKEEDSVLSEPQAASDGDNAAGPPLMQPPPASEPPIPTHAHAGPLPRDDSRASFAPIPKTIDVP